MRPIKNMKRDLQVFICIAYAVYSVPHHSTGSIFFSASAFSFQCHTCLRLPICALRNSQPFTLVGGEGGAPRIESRPNCVAATSCCHSGFLFISVRVCVCVCWIRAHFCAHPLPQPAILHDSIILVCNACFVSITDTTAFWCVCVCVRRMGMQYMMSINESSISNIVARFQRQFYECKNINKWTLDVLPAI